jgi:hypothetical protein
MNKNKQPKEVENNGLYTLLCGVNDESDLIEIKAPIGGLILSPEASVGKCKELYKEWMKSTFNEDV